MELQDNNQQTVIRVEDIHTSFGEVEIHSGISFSVLRGSIVAIIGGSGSGKSTLLREIIGLLRPSSGRVLVFGTDVWNCSEMELVEMRRRYGVLFQYSALFSGLTVGENIAVPLKEQYSLPDELLKCIIQLKLALTGLDKSTARKMPSDLSGGMKKRVALARALVLEPELLFLDEPTSGLDPVNARAFDELIRTLSNSLGLTIFMVTHDLDSITTIADRIIVLGSGNVIADGNLEEVMQVRDPWVSNYFSSAKAKRY
ncbi:MAG: ATP-binding cassette domain-containing protein [Deltaproteobacteria bacterium]|nr:ATP-binding cassette domain-containing protein [Deltaproteobacteria bacterium]